MDDCSAIQSVHPFAIKRFFSVSTRTPSALVYMEISSYPLYVNTYARCICRGAGWGVEGKQVRSMDEESQVRGCYNVLFAHQPTRPRQ